MLRRVAEQLLLVHRDAARIATRAGPGQLEAFGLPFVGGCIDLLLVDAMKHIGGEEEHEVSLMEKCLRLLGTWAAEQRNCDDA